MKMRIRPLINLIYSGTVILLLIFFSNSVKVLSSPLPNNRTEKSNEGGFDVLQQKVVSIGKLEFNQEIPIKYVNRNYLSTYLTSLFEEEYPEGLAINESILSYLMGFSKKISATNLRNIRKKLLLSGANGIYNEKNKEILAVNQFREVDYMNGMILAHELRHAIQDQHFNLEALSAARPPSYFDDRRLAIMAAIEGDATFLMIQFSKLDPEILISTPTADALMSFLPIANPNLLYKESPIIKHQLLMPYVKGLGFVTYVFKKKKWKGVNRILQLPPASTEQILHPEKYFEREEPQQVVIQYQPNDYIQIHSAVIGEYNINVLLSEDEYKFKDYALGWGGDTVQIYQKESSYFLAWKSYWDKEIYCSNFYSDYKRFIEKHFKVDLKKGNVKNIEFFAGKSTNGENYFFLMKGKTNIFFARADNRNQMNSFIYGGKYD